MRIIVLGGGLVGGPMAQDLAAEATYEVTVADISAEHLDRLEQLHPGIKTEQADLSEPGAVRSLLSDQDLVLSAVPGFMGFSTLKAVIESGRPVVDIAFFEEDPFVLDDIAKARNVTAIVDCGVAPGLSSLLIGQEVREFDQTERISIYVGGLPEERRWPFEYKSVFSPIDVIEEYTRPARFVENGRLTVRDALSDVELMDVPDIGTLEAFNSDGLRTLATTLDVPNMKEKTLRYPGHADKMRLFREAGFFGTKKIPAGDTTVRPIDLTSALLFPMWEREDDEGDITVLQVKVDGTIGGRRERHSYSLVDRYDSETGVHSMARTTGYPATMAIRMLVSRLYDRKGICPPEYIGQNDEAVAFILGGLAARGVSVQRTVDGL